MSGAATPDVHDVGRLGSCAGAREQQPLRPRAGIHHPLLARRRQQLAIRLVRALGDGDAEPVDEGRRHLGGHRDIPPADENRRHRRHVRIESRRDAPLDAAQIGIRRREILLAREQQRHVDRHARENRLFDRREPFLRPGDLDVEIAPPRLGVELAGGGERGLRVVREERRDFERHPPVDARRALEDRAEQVGRAREVFLRELEEERFAGFAFPAQRADLRVVGRASADRLIEDRRVRREPRHGQLGISAGGAGREQVAGDVVEPEALAEIVELTCREHRVAPSEWMIRGSYVCGTGRRNRGSWSLSVNKSRDAFGQNAMGCAKDGEARGRSHERAGRQSRPRILAKPFGNGQLGPIAL